MTIIRNHIELSGILQGIGCRPTVHRLASGLGLSGWVINTSDAVTIEIEGPEENCGQFLDSLKESIPVPGRIDRIVVTQTQPEGDRAFEIKNSSHGVRKITPIPPDVSVCPECVKELFDPKNRRFLYPFTTCTVCGPRFTVVRAFPYDRERTSMADFDMCQDCQKEYETPSDRRFHSQTNSCFRCGPELRLLSPDRSRMKGDPIIRTLELLKEGKIVAIKGIGGFHLSCDALNDRAVKLLRDRKGRSEKPFAVMMADLEVVKKYCVVSPREISAFTSMASPIVLVKAQGAKLSESVSPGISTIGVIQPYTPIHHLLFHHPTLNEPDLPLALVMTSGNRSEEPICKDNDEALDRLSDLADAFLIHNRDIVLRADDSIVRLIADKTVVLRRSRGFVPTGFNLDSADRSTVVTDARTQTSQIPDDPAASILGAGGDLKNVVAILKGNHVVPGPHVGDLASPIAQDYFESSLDVLKDYLDVEPDCLAFDPHPEYFSSRLPRKSDMLATPVFHHHAHAVSLLVEHGLKAPALFAVFDGTGYGPDGTIWGGEFLLADRASFDRIGHFSLFPLPGAESAIKEPARILAGLLWMAYGNNIPSQIPALLESDWNKARFWIESVKRGLNAPMTSSAGRLFDAAAVLAGFCRHVTFESQASMWFEGIADPTEYGKYEAVISEDEVIRIDSAALIRSMAEDSLAGTRSSTLSARFHNSMAVIVADVLELAAKRRGIDIVGLSGGCFQNRMLTEKSLEFLGSRGLRILTHETLPPNDGGIAVGQVACAFETLYSLKDTNPSE